jgi:uncharacterized Zn finger protein (UPF0148 family)
MTAELINEGDICSVCGLPVFFYGDAAIDCPQCGTEYVNSEGEDAD